MKESSVNFTGRQRRRSTHWSVKAKDLAAKIIIMIGGIGTIVAVATVCMFLIAVVIPLFRPPEVTPVSASPLPTTPRHASREIPLHTAVDEYNLMAWTMFPDGIIRKYRLDNGEILDEFSLADEDLVMTAWSFPQRGDIAIFGYADGSVRYATIQYKLAFIEMEDAPEHLRHIPPGATATHEKGLVQMTQERQLRHVTLEVSIQDPVDTGAGQPVVLLDHTGSRHEINYAAMTADGRIFMQRARGRRNMLTGKATYHTTTAEVEYEPRNKLPQYINLTGLGDNLYIIWADGILYRFDTRDFNAIEICEIVDVSPRPETAITAIGNMIGKTTLLVGDIDGNITGWFRVRPEAVSENPDLTVPMRKIEMDQDGINRGSGKDIKVAEILTSDNMALVPAQHLAGPYPSSPVTHIASSQRKRMFVAGHANGMLRVHNATVQRTLFETMMPNGQTVELAVFNPRDNGLIACSRDITALWHIDVPHSEATWKTYFRPVWYEGYAEPRHVWQSTGGTDDFESKFGIMPLVFGTIKATFYTMLFAVPLALLAAIFTSEFLHPKLKMKIKPTIEMMASLPSVVLGFLAGLVLAQFLETRVPAMLLSFVTLPFTLIFTATLWQMLPRNVQIRCRNFRFFAMMLMVPAGIWLAVIIAPHFENAFYAVRILDPEIARQLTGEMAAADIEYKDGSVVIRDFRTWLSAHRQDPAAPTFQSRATGGWIILFAPLSMLLGGFLTIRYINPFLNSAIAGRSRIQTAGLDMIKLLATTGAALLTAWALAALFGSFWDPRGGFIDQYVQRNALVVGFIMGFAVVPIIYTIADDAMSAVPEHLRAASLGAGATRWQTTVRIVIPTAMSGLFSAVMIGFGRAVGETMIVLMAAGNTPIMEWNIFSGFRTLSANIAVEMMEAVEGSTNYRTLFLAAVILFSMTFAINTIAEKVRQSYRKRTHQL